MIIFLTVNLLSSHGKSAQFKTHHPTLRVIKRLFTLTTLVTVIHVIFLRVFFSEIYKLAKYVFLDFFFFVILTNVAEVISAKTLIISAVIN